MYRLQRLVPYVLSLLEDAVPIVRATAVRVLCALLSMVTALPPSDANIFTLYIFPALQVSCTYTILSHYTLKHNLLYHYIEILC
jgi:hypothetical protein